MTKLREQHYMNNVPEKVDYTSDLFFRCRFMYCVHKYHNM